MVGRAHSKRTKREKHKCIDTVASVANTKKDEIIRRAEEVERSGSKDSSRLIYLLLY